MGDLRNASHWTPPRADIGWERGGAGVRRVGGGLITQSMLAVGMVMVHGSLRGKGLGNMITRTQTEWPLSRTVAIWRSHLLLCIYIYYIYIYLYIYIYIYIYGGGIIEVHSGHLSPVKTYRWIQKLK